MSSSRDGSPATAAPSSRGRSRTATSPSTDASAAGSSPPSASARATSGVILVAKDDLTHHGLASQFRLRTVRKTYWAIVRGVMELDADLVSAPIGNHKRLPTRMSVRFDVGRASETYYEVVERFKRHS